MVLGKLSVPGRPTNLDYSRAIFSVVYHFSLLSPSLWETARYRLKYCLRGPLSPKQQANQHNKYSHCLLAKNIINIKT